MPFSTLLSALLAAAAPRPKSNLFLYNSGCLLSCLDPPPFLFRIFFSSFRFFFSGGDVTPKRKKRQTKEERRSQKMNDPGGLVGSTTQTVREFVTQNYVRSASCAFMSSFIIR
jgi:hypothetical protein